MSHRRTLGCATLNASPLQTVEAAAAAGFESVGIRISGRRPGDDFETVVGQRSTLAAIRRRAQDLGVRLSNVTAYHLYPEVGLDQLRRIVASTADLGAPLIVVNVYLPDRSAAVDTVGRYCELARDAGCRLALEFVPFSAIRSLQDARSVREQLKARNLGLVIDPLHLARSGGHPSELRDLDPSAIALVQLCDARTTAHAASSEELRDEARNRRLFPGDGDLPLGTLLSLIPADTELEYEVPRRNLAALTIVERARVAFSVLDSFLSDQAGRT